MRLTGLPSVSSARRATVAREEDRLVVRFELPDGALQRFDVPFYTLGEDVDPEAAELRLLAQLAALGYEVTRWRP